LPIVYMDWTKHVIEYESNSDIFWQLLVSDKPLTGE
jgi:hypothetical protein